MALKSLEYLHGPRVAISGGSTYNYLFDIWAEEKRLKEMSFYPVDERSVPFGDPDCNWKGACDKLLDPLGFENPEKRLASSKAQYEALLKEEFKGEVIFDQVFLGMGDDGHTASLFPGGEYLSDGESVVLETTSPKPPHSRITLGLGTIRKAKQLILIVWGENKKEMVRRMRGGDTSLPVTLAMQGHPESVALLDKAAAG